MSLLQKVRKPICEKFWAHGKHHMAKVLTITTTIVMVTLWYKHKLQRAGIKQVPDLNYVLKLKLQVLRLTNLPKTFSPNVSFKKQSQTFFIYFLEMKIKN